MGASSSKSLPQTARQQEHSHLMRHSTNTGNTVGPHEDFHAPYPRSSKPDLYQRQLETEQELFSSMADIRMTSGQLHSQQVEAMNQRAIDLAIRASLAPQQDQYHQQQQHQWISHHSHQAPAPGQQVALTMDMIRESSGAHLY